MSVTQHTRFIAEQKLTIFSPIYTGAQPIDDLIDTALAGSADAEESMLYGVVSAASALVPACAHVIRGAYGVCVGVSAYAENPIPLTFSDQAMPDTYRALEVLSGGTDLTSRVHEAMRLRAREMVLEKTGFCSNAALEEQTSFEYAALLDTVPALREQKQKWQITGLRGGAYLLASFLHGTLRDPEAVRATFEAEALKAAHLDYE